MHFRANLTTHGEGMNVKEAREHAVGAAVITVAQAVMDRALPRNQAVRALKPIFDSTLPGDRSKGRAEIVERITQDNLDAALDTLTQRSR